jgi:hypothetical protein
MRTVKHPNLSKTCETCGDMFYRKHRVTYAQWANARFCSHGCNKDAGKRKTESANPVYKSCEHCSAEFTVRQYRKDTARFCSPACKKLAQDSGISTENEKLRRGTRYKAWRSAVFKRDDHTCQECGVRGGTLNADHIKPFAVFPEGRFEVSNGRTLCRDCHLQTPTFGRKALAYA